MDLVASENHQGSKIYQGSKKNWMSLRVIRERAGRTDGAFQEGVFRELLMGVRRDMEPKSEVSVHSIST